MEPLEILPIELLKSFSEGIEYDPIEVLNIKSREKLPVDYFEFYNTVSTVYSSKIEGEEIDFDSFYKHKFLNVKYQPDYTKRSDDLYNAYEFIYDNELNLENVLMAHSLLSQNLLPESQRGKIRNNPMFVINEEDRIEYIACDHFKVKVELETLFSDIEELRMRDLNTIEKFYFASLIHLVFVKIHPLQDGNGRTARLIEKWFLLESIGKEAISVELEKNYYLNRKAYYQNIRMLGLEYSTLDYSKALHFLLMTINSFEMK